jgi:hypothetical protein
MQTWRYQDLGSCLIPVLKMMWRQRKAWCEEGKGTGGDSLFLDSQERILNKTCLLEKEILQIANIP